MTQATIHKTICRPGYATQNRPSRTWTHTVKRRFLRQAGVPFTASKAYELDHLVPLNLAGCPTCLTNLWLQPWDGPTGAKVKDQTEIRLYLAVRAEHIPLAVAQRCFQEDWQRYPQ